MALIYDEEDLAAGVAPLSKEERAWVRKLSRVLQACPTDRLALVTIGDAGLTVTDDTYRKQHDLPDHDDGPRRHGFALAEVHSKPLIHGVSG
jgi:hypothetical protein